MANKFFRFVRDRIYDVDILREKSYADKDQSNTRLVFTILLLLVMGGTFGGFFFYYAIGRTYLIQYLTPSNHGFVLYEDYQEYVEDAKFRISCTSSQAVPLSMVMYNDNSVRRTDSNLTAEFLKLVDQNCKFGNGNLTSTILSAVCEYSFDSSFYQINNYDLLPGILFDEVGLEVVLGTIVNSTATNIYTSQRASLSFSSILVNYAANQTSVTESGQTRSVQEYITVLEEGDSIPNIISSSVFTSFYGANSEWKISHEAYFKLANVTSCQYLEKDGWLSIFNDALNATQSFLTIFLFFAGLIYSAFKSAQRSDKVRGKVDPVLRKVGKNISNANIDMSTFKNVRIKRIRRKKKTPSSIKEGTASISTDSGSNQNLSSSTLGESIIIDDDVEVEVEIEENEQEDLSNQK